MSKAIKVEITKTGTGYNVGDVVRVRDVLGSYIVDARGMGIWINYDQAKVTNKKTQFPKRR